jgi:hypothetical protein
MKMVLQEFLPYSHTNYVVESKDDMDSSGRPVGKSLYLSGICVQGGVRNHNQRVYPVNEISRAVRSIQEQIDNNFSVLGEADHPQGLTVNLDRVSHVITKMWMEGSNGYGKLKILPTPMGQLIKVMLESGVKLGVSSRGSGEVDHNGEVKGFEIITVDVVATPSAPGAYPTPIYEHLMNTSGGYRAFQVANEVQQDAQAQRYIKEKMINIINNLK